MKSITINCTSRDAEELLISLLLRASQKGVGQDTKIYVEELRKRVNDEATKAFGWDVLPDRHAPNGDIRVTITSRNRW